MVLPAQNVQIIHISITVLMLAKTAQEEEIIINKMKNANVRLINLFTQERNVLHVIFQITLILELENVNYVLYHKSTIPISKPAQNVRHLSLLTVVLNVKNAQQTNITIQLPSNVNIVLVAETISRRRRYANVLHIHFGIVLNVLNVIFLIISTMIKNNV